MLVPQIQLELTYIVRLTCMGSLVCLQMRALRVHFLASRVHASVIPSFFWRVFSSTTSPAFTQDNRRTDDTRIRRVEVDILQIAFPTWDLDSPTAWGRWRRRGGGACGFGWRGCWTRATTVPTIGNETITVTTGREDEKRRVVTWVTFPTHRVKHDIYSAGNDELMSVRVSQ